MKLPTFLRFCSRASVLLCWLLTSLLRPDGFSGNRGLVLTSGGEAEKRCGSCCRVLPEMDLILVSAGEAEALFVSGCFVVPGAGLVIRLRRGGGGEGCALLAVSDPDGGCEAMEPVAEGVGEAVPPLKDRDASDAAGVLVVLDMLSDRRTSGFLGTKGGFLSVLLVVVVVSEKVEAREGRGGGASSSSAGAAFAPFCTCAASSWPWYGGGRFRRRGASRLLVESERAGIRRGGGAAGLGEGEGRSTFTQSGSALAV